MSLFSICVAGSFSAFHCDDLVCDQVAQFRPYAAYAYSVFEALFGAAVFRVCVALEMAPSAYIEQSDHIYSFILEFRLFIPLHWLVKWSFLCSSSMTRLISADL